MLSVRRLHFGNVSDAYEHWKTLNCKVDGVNPQRWAWCWWWRGGNESPGWNRQGHSQDVICAKEFNSTYHLCRDCERSNRMWTTVHEAWTFVLFCDCHPAGHSLALLSRYCSILDLVQETVICEEEHSTSESGQIRPMLRARWLVACLTEWQHGQFCGYGKRPRRRRKNVAHLSPQDQPKLPNLRVTQRAEERV